jgi:hypothetical protein
MRFTTEESKTDPPKSGLVSFVRVSNILGFNI